MDLIIRNVTLYDGSGAEPKKGVDVAVKDGKIAEIGSGLGARGREEVDGGGLALMPGIIDSHTHYDAQITWDPMLNPSSALGVTTVLIGNCGFTIAPCRPGDRDLLIRNLTQVEGMSLDVLRNGVRWDFEDFPGYLQMIESRGTAVNLAAFVGHSAIRNYVLGDEASSRAATSEEVESMATIVRNAMDAGAVGFSTSYSPQHHGWGGIPMPSRLGDEFEFTQLVKAMAEGGRGVFMITKGGIATVPFLENVAAQAGCPMMVAAILHNSTMPQNAFNDLEEIAAARERGRELWGQVSCTPITYDFTLEGAYPFEGITAWKPAMKLHGEELKGLLASPEFRSAVRNEIENPPKGVRRLFNGEWHKIGVLKVRDAENSRFEQRNVAELAMESSVHPLDWLLDLGVSEDLKTEFTAMLLNSDEDAVAKLLVHPSASVSLSDAGAHLTFICDAGFGLHLMGHWSRDKKVMSLPHTIHELTQKPARIFRLAQRGLVAPGYYADLLLFDPDTVGRSDRYKVNDLPGGNSRLHTDAIGVAGVWVNGEKVADGSGVIESSRRAGRVIREFESWRA